MLPLSGRMFPPDCDSPLPILDNPPHGTDQTIGIEDDIGVGAESVWVSGGVDPGVEGVCPPAVLLVDHSDVEWPVSAVDRPHGAVAMSGR